MAYPKAAMTIFPQRALPIPGSRMAPVNYQNRYNPVGPSISGRGYSTLPVKPLPRIVNPRQLRRLRQLNRTFSAVPISRRGLGDDGDFTWAQAAENQNFVVEKLDGGWVAVVPEGTTVTNNLSLPSGSVVSDIWGNIVKAIGPISTGAANIIKAFQNQPKSAFPGANVPGMRYDPALGRYLPTSNALPSWLIPAAIGLGAAYFFILKK